MTASDPRQDRLRVGELLQQTFETREAAPLDTPMIQLMLELSRAREEGSSPAMPAPEAPRRPLFGALFSRHFLRR